MIKRVAVLLMMGHLLACSILLPLGDFSLLKELPGMYRAYEKVASPDDKGIFDFVGDYLLGGKALLGHNKHDRPDKSNTIQFHHAATFALIVYTHCIVTNELHNGEAAAYNAVHLPGKPTDYHSSLLRPPLA